MANEQDRRNQQAPGRKPLGSDDSSGGRGQDSQDELQRRRGGLFHRFGARIQEAAAAGRGDDDVLELDEPTLEPVSPVRPAAAPAARVVEDTRPARDTRAAIRTVIPEGVVINGSMTSTVDAEVSGKIEGDVTIEGRLYLGPTALIAGNVRATACKIEGMVDGKVECTQDLEIGESGRLNADAIAQRKLVLAGQVTGHVTTGGLLRLLPTARIAGDIRARSIVIEEGAFFNGKCIMRPSGDRQAQASS